MKQIVPVFFICFCFRGHAQDSTNFQKLFSQFAQVYFASEKKDSLRSCFASLENASRVLNSYNIEFKQAKKDLKTAYPSKDNQWLVQTLSDSIVHLFTTTLLWKGHESVLIKYEKPFQVFLEKSCPCYTQKIKENKNLSTISAICDQEILKDPGFITKLSVSLANFNPVEKMEAQSFVFQYSFQNCKPLNDVIVNIIHDEVYEEYYSYMQDLAFDADRKLLYYFNNNKKDSINFLFPGFARFELNVKQAAPFYKKEITGPTTIKKQKESLTLTKTFIHKEKVLGRAVYKLNYVDEEIKFVDFIFLSPDKISRTEKDKILKELKEIPPPPPMEIIKN
jgi:hypothetical protein